METSIIHVFALIAILSVANAQAPKPAQVPFSGNAYGLDGPWNVVKISVGNPPQDVELFPGSKYWTPILSNTYCHNKNFTKSGYSCYARPLGFYDKSASSTEVDLSPDPSYPLWSFTFLMNGRCNYISDTITVGSIPVSRVKILYTEWAYYIYHDGREIPAAMGQLSLGGIQPYKPEDNSFLLPNQLYYHQNTPSASFGLHIGSAAPNIPGGIPGSLWFGGYDKKRVIGPVLNATIAVNNPPFVLGLKNLGFTSLSTDGKLRNQTDFLKGNTEGDYLEVDVQSQEPYFIFPKWLCDAMTADLPITFNSTGNFYLWNTSDPAYTTTLFNGPNYYSFTLNNPTNRITINVPMTLLHLNLTAPLVATHTPYFPCITTGGPQYVLGQAFLQATFLAGNWQPNQNYGGDAQFYVAQAPGPSLDTAAESAMISDNVNEDPFPDISEEDSFVLWARSWYPFFNEHGGANLKIPPMPQPSSTSSLSSGAIAGIVVGVVVFVVLIVGALLLYLRVLRRRSRDKLNDGMGESKEPAELQGNARHETAGWEVKPELKGDTVTDPELPYYHAKYEMETGDNQEEPSIYELSARGDAVVETGSTQGSPALQPLRLN